MRHLLVSVALMTLASTAQAQLFTPGGSFTVTTTGTPGGGGSDTGTLTTGLRNLSNAGLNLSISTATSSAYPGGEWLVFQYSSDSTGLPLAPAGGSWSVNEVGLPATEALNIDRAYVQFDASGAEVAFNSSPFSNFTVASAPPSDLSSILSGPGLFAAAPSSPVGVGGPGPLESLGTSFQNFNATMSGVLPNNVAPGEITSYTEALEFSPVGGVTPGVPEPSTWAMMALGFGLLGLLGYRKTRSDNALA